MYDSVLTTVKNMLGIEEDDKAFDTEICMHINSAFGVLRQLGVGPETGFSVFHDTSVWSDFTEEPLIDLVKEYVFLKVKSVFDPPSSSTAVEAINTMTKELEWRINVEKENSLLHEAE